MSRSGYNEGGDQENWDYIRWRGAVTSAIRGKKGQAFLREMREALDAIPIKELAAEVLVEDKVAVDGESPKACALGVIALKRKLDVSRIDIDFWEGIHHSFNISNALAREIIWINDEAYYPKNDAERWRAVRWWVEANIIPLPVKPIAK